ncbi:hypothetical protein DV738_g4002, partial [Chaetothyriales sp. CBS 135597]
MAPSLNLPDFDSLPPVEGLPQGTAWGIFDKDGKKDVVGSLNLLTPDVVKEAYKEARDGVSISLNWPLGAQHTPGFSRKTLHHHVIDFNKTPLAGHGFDDEISFNTQCSSQWDSLVHYLHQPTASAYNGFKPTQEGLVQAFGEQDTTGKYPTLHHWHTRGGLVGRGVLLDYRAWKASKGETYSPFDDTAITIAELEEIAAWEKVELREGDILIVRTGYTEELSKPGITAEEQAALTATHKAIGVEGNVAAAKWFWNHHFAAVAGDALAFEVLPPRREDGSVGSINELVLHQYFLALFGLNIGELWDLKALGEHAQKVGRYSFLLTSVPLNVPGAVGSPPNALALF